MIPIAAPPCPARARPAAQALRAGIRADPLIRNKVRLWRGGLRVRDVPGCA